MAGYNGFSMSNNAVAAYDIGLCPASKIRGVPACLVKKYARYEEIHHTSSKYNMTKFYNTQEVRILFGLEPENPDEELFHDEQAIQALANFKNDEAERRAATKLAEIYQIPNTFVEYLDWPAYGKGAPDTITVENAFIQWKPGTTTIKIKDQYGGLVAEKRSTTRGFTINGLGSILNRNGQICNSLKEKVQTLTKVQAEAVGNPTKKRDYSLEEIKKIKARFGYVSAEDEFDGIPEKFTRENVPVVREIQRKGFKKIHKLYYAKAVQGFFKDSQKQANRS